MDFIGLVVILAIAVIAVSLILFLLIVRHRLSEKSYQNQREQLSECSRADSK